MEKVCACAYVDAICFIVDASNKASFVIDLIQLKLCSSERTNMLNVPLIIQRHTGAL